MNSKAEDLTADSTDMVNQYASIESKQPIGSKVGITQTSWTISCGGNLTIDRR